MQNKYTSWFAAGIFAVLCMSLSVPVAFADDPFDPADGGAGNITPGKSGGITNPLQGVDSITDVLTKVINFMLGLVGIIALIALITAGARMIFGFVDEDQVKKAKTTILWAVIGLAVVILSYAIINIVTSEILGTGTGKPYDTN